MKCIILINFVISSVNSFAQRDSINSIHPRYSIHLTTMNCNVLKGLLLLVKDSSVWVYPGNGKEWKTNVRYKPVEFVYSRILEITLKRENSALKKIQIGGSRKGKIQINGNGTAFIEFKKLIQ